MLNAIILQHENQTTPGTTIDWLKRNKINFQIIRLYEQFLFPNLKDFDLLIICGGSMNVDETKENHWLKSEKEFIRSCVDAHKKIIGLCLGSQLLAEVLGAKVARHAHTELGWQQVEFVQNPTLPLDQSKPTKLDVFQFHSYAFELPSDSFLLATNEACQQQAFIYGNHILGFQFHPESTPGWIQECADEDSLPVGGYCQTKEQIIFGSHLQKKLQDWYFDYLDRFMRL